MVDPQSTVENNLRFQGQYFDAETGFHYDYHRYYDPRTGRYITPDPIGLSGGINLYVYVGNDPVNGVDPLGLLVRVIANDAEKNLILTYFNQMTGSNVSIDSNGYVSPDFSSPEPYSNIAASLKQMIASEKQIDVRFIDNCPGGAGSFKGGVVGLDRGCLINYPNSCSYKSGYFNYDYFAGPDTLAHELLGHGYDWMFNDMPGNSFLMPKSEKEKWERSAVGRANEVIDLLGKKRRY